MYILTRIWQAYYICLKNQCQYLQDCNILPHTPQKGGYLMVETLLEAHDQTRILAVSRARGYPAMKLNVWNRVRIVGCSNHLQKFGKRTGT